MASHKIINLRNEEGGLFLDSSGPADGVWAGFQVVEDAIISAIEMPDFENSDLLLGVVLPQGYISLGYISSITLSDGKIQLFNYISTNRLIKD